MLQCTGIELTGNALMVVLAGWYFKYSVLQKTVQFIILFAVCGGPALVCRQVLRSCKNPLVVGIK